MTTLAAPLGQAPALKAWLAYAVAGLAVTGAVAGLSTLLVSGAAVTAIWVSAGLAYSLQMLAFAGLVAVRQRPSWFLAGWALGIALRFGALGGVAWWLSRSAALPRAAALLSLVAFVFLLLLLEPVFLRWGLRKP